MLVVLPYCARDVQLASQLLDYIPPLGPYVGHQALLIHPPGVPDLVQKAAQSFKTVVSLEVPDVNGGWPFGPNAMFAAAAESAAQLQLGPFYFFEPDNTPTRAGWLGALENEYHSFHSPFMGAVVPTRVMRRGVECLDGTHMVGSGIYPQDVAARITLFDTVRHTPYPWDCYLQWEIVPQCHATDKIQHAWNTCKAQRRANGITLKPGNDIARGAKVRPDAAVVHGVKDGSLMRLLA